MPRILRWLLPRLTVSIVVVVLILVGLELVVRNLDLVMDSTQLGPSPMNNSAYDAACFRSSLTRGWEAVPGKCGHNEWGMYGDYPHAKADGVYRILVLGDSIADQRTWVNQMEARLRGLAPGKKIEVWNAGVPGYDTCTELQVLNEQGLALKPDLVLVQFCLNDYLVASTVVPLDDGRIRVHAGETVTDLPRWVLSSRLLTYGVVSLGFMSSYAHHDVAPEERHLTNSWRCFASMKLQLEAQGGRLATAIFPAFITGEAKTPQEKLATGGVIGGHKEGEARVKMFMEKLKVSHVELRKAFEGLGPLEGYREAKNDIWHPNRHGQHIIGEALSKALAPVVRGELKRGGTSLPFTMDKEAAIKPPQIPGPMDSAGTKRGPGAGPGPGPGPGPGQGPGQGSQGQPPPPQDKPQGGR